MEIHAHNTCTHLLSDWLAGRLWLFLLLLQADRKAGGQRLPMLLREPNCTIVYVCVIAHLKELQASGFRV